MKKISLIIGLAALFALPAHAELTTADTTSPEYLRNHGYSNALINTMQQNKAQINNTSVETPENEYYKMTPVKFIRKLFMYLDPALDDNSFGNGHDIKTSPNYQDL